MIDLDALSALARQAGRVILDYAPSRNETMRRKEDGSPVTMADEAAERLITEGLGALYPHWPVIGEEAASAGLLPEQRGGFFLVDPLDGTKEFLRGGNDYTVNIGLIQNGQPVAGIVHVPEQDLTYAGQVDSGAQQKRGNGPWMPIAVRPPPADGLTVVASSSHGDRETLAAFLARLPVREMRQIGSSLKICLLAEGAADLYPRFGPTMEWDTAAAHAVLRAAGGQIVRTDGLPLPYGKPEYRNPAFIAWAQLPKSL